MVAPEADDRRDDASDEDSDDGELDIDDIAEQAIRTACKAVKHDCSPISLDTSISMDQLYFRGLGTKGGHKRLYTGAQAGVSRLNIEDFAIGCTTPTPAASSQRREVRGAEVRPVNDEKLRRKEAKKQREEKLEKWFGLPKQKLTPELEKELKAIKLRANFDPKRFYKANDSSELPKHFVVATEVGGGMAPVGLNSSTLDINARRGRSFLDTLVRDQKVQEWTAKRASEVSARVFASRFSGHGRPQKQGEGRRNRRGGAWKKIKKG